MRRNCELAKGCGDHCFRGVLFCAQRPEAGCAKHARIRCDILLALSSGPWQSENAADMLRGLCCLRRVRKMGRYRCPHGGCEPAPVVSSRRAPDGAWSRGRSPHRARPSDEFVDDPDHSRRHGHQDAFTLPECMSGPSVCRNEFGSLPTVVSCLTLVPYGAWSAAGICFNTRAPAARAARCALQVRSSHTGFRVRATSL
jgi:hypothetical protein